MIHILAICASFLGFGCLCAAMARHQKDLLGRTLPRQAQRWLRGAGGAVLLVALATDMAELGAAYGTIAWFGHLTIGAAMAVTGLKWKTA
ncbi:DUF3325 domain-containing protein [Sphingobium sp. YR768]|uniref:DUF3325 domain-containing protein n=1 Tax=Sphingobium sp. YR768 TaxID=1884365 RepID=UPI0008C73ABD|nr:DUF3325 domain-containing protein [Sphingobium sp. YR768]SER83257.1 Protein of unknown function [Sphingobium sp. YR768]